MRVHRGFHSSKGRDRSPEEPADLPPGRPAERAGPAGDFPTSPPTDFARGAGEEEAEAPAPRGARDAAWNSGPGFSDETVRFVRQLPSRRLDAAWHERNQRRYEAHLRGPATALLERVREQYIQPLSPEVAGGRRRLSALKKNGYGKGAWHDDYWFAFYDPAVCSKARSARLYFKLSGVEQSCEYGFSAGPAGGSHLRRFCKAVHDAPAAASARLLWAPDGAQVVRRTRDHARAWPADRWRDLLRCDIAAALGAGLPVTDFCLRRTFPLAQLPGRDAALPDDVGRFFAWAWPFFEAARTGRWPGTDDAPPAGPSADGSASGSEGGSADASVEGSAGAAEDAVEVDERAPRTVEELARRTCLSAGFLADLEESLLGQRQVVLCGPPGTSKTYLARQFARYFARQAPGRPQGASHTLYLHANWGYEDFFEGLRPAEGSAPHGSGLAFENKPGQFLRWVADELKGQHPLARHVLVLDELNRCDTAAVLGELLQLLEYRGVTVPLRSGRPFVLPANLYLVGTMNSADRSVSRMDLALRRRFLWIDLKPDPDVLGRWLSRPGNNPAGFRADALRACNDLLASRGVPPGQQVGHALFMGGRGAEDSDSDADPNGDPDTSGAAAGDLPLTQSRLRQVVRYGVVPYVKELLDAQLSAYGQGDDDELLGRIETLLLGACVRADPTPARRPPV